jgi:hypothetical protein
MSSWLKGAGRITLELARLTATVAVFALVMPILWVVTGILALSVKWTRRK